ncbi:MAG: response regulator [Gemmiger sp.]|nr:response regulator [Gemmiger sp.]
MQDKTGYTVVVADDEDELREAVCTMIPWKKLGFCLVGNANNGLDALELVEKLEPDLLLTDIRMPFISGIELARQVREIRPAMNIAFLSGYDDFEYAKQAIQYNIISYMLKPLTMEGLAQELGKIKEKIDAQFLGFQQRENLGRRQADRENFLVPLLLDGYAYGGYAPAAEAELARWGADCGLLRGTDDHPRFVVMVTCFTGFAGQGGIGGQTRQGRAGPDNVRVVEMLAEKYLRHVSFFSCGKVVTLLMGNASDFEEYLHILGDELVQVAQRVLGCHCTVGISRGCNRLGGLHAAYREAMEAIRYTKPEESSVCFISDRQPQPGAVAVNTAELLGRVVDACRAGSRAEADAGLDAMIEAARAEQLGRAWLDAISLQLVSEIYKMLYTFGTDAVAELQKQAALTNVGFQYRNNAELKDELEAFCFCAMEILNNQQKKGGSLICQRALEAINQHYRDETLSLVSLSAMLDISPNHLSACIKKYAGESFINVLIQKRMDAARELLLTTPLKIQEVAQRCGYTDQHYFSYCFKKYSGVSPNTLRRQHEAGKDGNQ